MRNVTDDKKTTMNVLLPITSIATLLVCCGDKYCDECESDTPGNNITSTCESNKMDVEDKNSERYNNPTKSSCA